MADIRAEALIILDGVFFQLSRTGIARVWLSLLEKWSTTEFAKHLLILNRQNTVPVFPKIRYRSINPYVVGNFEQESLYLDQICREEKATLFVSTYYTYPATFRSVQPAYDMIPEVLNFDLTEPQWAEKQNAFRRASGFVCISENTRQDVLKCVPGAKPESAIVAHPGVSPEKFFPANTEQIVAFHTRYNIQRPYFLLVGPARNYKNVDLFFESLALLCTHPLFEVILVGGYINEADVAEWSKQFQVRHMSLSDDELRAAYTGAVALVYPSLYEGFGLPLLEAMACGCPVVTTPFSSIPEVAGHAALYVKNAAELADALCEVQKPTVQARLVQSGLKNVKGFSWKNTAEKIASFLLSQA